VDAASAGDTIVVEAGNYAETVSVTKSGLTFVGANEGLAGSDGGRGSESIVVGGFHLAPGADGTTIRGMKIEQGALITGETAGVYVQADNVTIEDTVLERTGGFDSARAILVAVGGQTGLTVEDVQASGFATGMFINPDAEATVTGNVFRDNFVGLSNDGPLGATDISGNEFIDNQFEQIGIGATADPTDASAVVGANTFTGTAPEVSVYPLSGVEGADVTGTENNDVFNGDQTDTALGQTFSGLGGDDVINGGGGNDTLDGGSDDDTMVAGAGNDVIDGGSGIDLYDASAATGSMVINLDVNPFNFSIPGAGFAQGGGLGTDGLTNIEAIRGGDFDDNFVGDAEDNTVFASLGQDELDGGAGSDTYDASESVDTVTIDLEINPFSFLVSGTGFAQGIQIGTDGLTGFENLIGGAGDDGLSGDAANNTLEGNDGDDVLVGRGGVDTISGGAGNDGIRGNSGEDTLSGGDGNDFINGGGGADNIFGDEGNDDLRGARGDDVMDGGAGNDIVAGDVGNDSLSGGAGNDQLRGQEGDDTLNGGSGEDELRGGSGIDTLNGGEDDDRLFGDGDNDTLFGDAGNDFLSGSVGADILRGGDGVDVLFGGTDGDQLFGDAGNDNLFGEAGDDELSGDDGDDTLYGGVGDDTLSGGAGIDFLSGEDGNDELRGGADADTLRGNDGADELFGEAGDDDLNGGRGNDLLDGGDGNDVLRGGVGDDELNGGAGADIFDLRGGDGGSDTVIGFDNTDTISLVGFGYTSLADAEADFTQVGADVVFDGNGTNAIATFLNATLSDVVNAIVVPGLALPASVVRGVERAADLDGEEAIGGSASLDAHFGVGVQDLKLDGYGGSQLSLMSIDEFRAETSLTEVLSTINALSFDTLVRSVGDFSDLGGGDVLEIDQSINDGWTSGEWDPYQDQFLMDFTKENEPFDNQDVTDQMDLSRIDIRLDDKDDAFVLSETDYYAS